ncbi:hypothetical protein M900_1110 [Bacteriovorax sp. Seq25_V]|nr:hypothetical protein M900_1110 [Bacteriovorax sp. Seq25_V]
MLHRIAIILLISLCANTIARETYTKDDLKVLFKQKSYQEYLDHYLDIRPTQRDEDWKKMTLEMLALSIKTATEKKEFSNQTFDSILGYLSNATLKTDHYAQFIFAKYALGFFQVCVDSKSNCQSKLQEYWSSSKRFVEIDQQLFHLAQVISSEIADQVLISILNDDSSKIYCSKMENFKNIKALLIKTVSSQDSTDQTFKNVAHIMDESCRKAIASELKKETITTKNNSEREKLYKYLKAFQMTDEKFEATALTLYLLNGPAIGDVFNFAWNKLSGLSQDHKLRETVLENIKSFQTLPDDIVNISDQKRSDVIITYINKNFPEYFEVYTRACIDYYSGARSFPKGNPTLYCDKFIERSKKKNWVSEALIQRYIKAKKI